MQLTDFAKRLMAYRLIDHLCENPARNMRSAMESLNALCPDNLFPTQRQALTAIASDPNDSMNQLIMRIMDLNPQVRNDLIKKLAVDANLMAWGKQERMRMRYECNIPWAILLDPTSACNLHCTGCWASEYGRSLNLTYDQIDSIIEQGTSLGTHIYIYTGGEPLIRKDDLIKLARAHQDCVFLCFTNATLVDEALCQDLLSVKNLVLAISVEGDEASTDARRGAGTYEKVSAAMGLLSEHGLPFGVSICYTHDNAESVATDEFFDWLIGKGALFAWIFTYMPVGADAPTSLMPTSEDRLELYRFSRRIRETKPILTMDFQHDGEFVGGCIAAGRRYLHINANGDVEPCVFIHYSNANIKEMPLIECLQSPLFMEYYRRHPFNENPLRPCPMLENPACIEEMVRDSGAASTYLEAGEDASELAEKCRASARMWTPVAESLWADERDPRAHERASRYCGMSESDVARFEALGRVLHGAFDPRRRGE